MGGSILDTVIAHSHSIFKALCLRSILEVTGVESGGSDRSGSLGILPGEEQVCRLHVLKHNMHVSEI